MKGTSNRKKLVLKLGTSTLTGGTRKLNRSCMLEIVRALRILIERGWQVAVVSSGAIAAGRELLGYPNLPSELCYKQMLSAAGQGKLFEIWEDLFSIYDLHIGQLLLTKADLENRERYLNARDTLTAMLDYGVIPVIKAELLPIVTATVVSTLLVLAVTGWVHQCYSGAERRVKNKLSKKKTKNVEEELQKEGNEK